MYIKFEVTKTVELSNRFTLRRLFLDSAVAQISVWTCNSFHTVCAEPSGSGVGLWPASACVAFAAAMGSAPPTHLLSAALTTVGAAGFRRFLLFLVIAWLPGQGSHTCG